MSHQISILTAQKTTIEHFRGCMPNNSKSFALAKLAFFMAIKESDFNTDGSFKDQTLAVIGDIYKR